MFLGMPAQPDGSTGLRNMRADAGIGGIPYSTYLLCSSHCPLHPHKSVNRTLIKSLLMSHCPETVPGLLFRVKDIGSGWSIIITFSAQDTLGLASVTQKCTVQGG